VTPARQSPPVPIVGDRHVTEVRVHKTSLLFIEYSFNKIIFFIEMQWLVKVSNVRSFAPKSIFDRCSRGKSRKFQALTWLVERASWARGSARCRENLTRFPARIAASLSGV
ncbi:hypothetical protein, partial [Mesorhizobium sp. M7D.F.Ca.US.004.03.1.1]|uniref:hypothetical protein n=1 Tax=Mesorhizobium sp. M7D.F.Ca.US.004.03.1.1 TaxID=2496702 RepID=UPI0019D2645E